MIEWLRGLDETTKFAIEVGTVFFGTLLFEAWVIRQVLRGKL